MEREREEERVVICGGHDPAYRKCKHEWAPEIKTIIVA